MTPDFPVKFFDSNLLWWAFKHDRTIYKIGLFDYEPWTAEKWCQILGWAITLVYHILVNLVLSYASQWIIHRQVT